MTERRLKLSHILSLAFIAAIFTFAMVSSLPDDNELLTDSVVQSSETMQAS